MSLRKEERREMNKKEEGRRERLPMVL